MGKNSIGLSKFETELLETLLAEHGEVVTFEHIFSQIKIEKSRQQTRNLVSKLTQSGWLVRLKKGLYYITSLASRGRTALSGLAIAQFLEKDSYVSFETALQYHSMFDQHLKTITAITTKKKKEIKIQKTNYVFIHTTEKNFYGYEEKWEGGFEIKVASAEKALLDMLSFRRSSYAVDLVEEKLREYGHRLDMEKLIKLSQAQSVRVKRLLGFLLDRHEIDTTLLQENIIQHKGASFMTEDSNQFNSKWRLYYHNHFV